MTESLLSFSEVLLFGRVMEDLEVKKDEIESTARLATLEKVANLNDVDLEIDGVDIADGDRVLVRRNNATLNGIYTVATVGTSTKKKLETREVVPQDRLVAIEGRLSAPQPRRNSRPARWYRKTGWSP